MSVSSDRRLDLRPMSPADVAELFAVYADPRMWAHDPPRVHRDAEQTASYVARAATRWTSDGLSYWTVRLAGSAEVIGSGGAQRHRVGDRPEGTAFWNLNYRIAAAHQGRGYAGEVLAAALAAAVALAPELPAIAWIDATNPASRRVAVRGGLLDRGLRRGSIDGVVRHAYADRQLDDDYPQLSAAG